MQQPKTTTGTWLLPQTLSTTTPHVAQLLRLVAICAHTTHTAMALLMQRAFHHHEIHKGQATSTVCFWAAKTAATASRHPVASARNNLTHTRRTNTVYVRAHPSGHATLDCCCHSLLQPRGTMLSGLLLLLLNPCPCHGPCPCRAHARHGQQLQVTTTQNTT